MSEKREGYNNYFNQSDLDTNLLHQTSGSMKTFLQLLDDKIKGPVA